MLAALRGEQPGVRTQRPRIYKQPGTGTQEPCCFLLVWSLFGCLFGFRQTARVGTQVPEEAEAPVAVLPSPLGYCLRVSGGMERWLP